MNFFEHQEVARRNTGRLVVLFALAIIGIVALVYVAITIALSFSGAVNVEDGLWRGDLLLYTTLGVLAVVLASSAYKIASLSEGGKVVAEMLGGRLIDPGTDDLGQRRLLNIVEEMAIASGTPVPQVYFMAEESGINAFAAGHSPSDAVIGVTRGCVEQLNRDELQGVVAHEFSHILNGDMRLNIRLMGVIHGIIVLGLIGYFLMRSSVYSGSGRRRGSNDKGGGVLAILAFGVALIVIGYVGTFFGNLIKAGVSRQREYLADASAVQFTRNPDGIAGALKKIGGWQSGSKMRAPQAEEVSHMLFGAGSRSFLGASFSTHPPLADRIRRIDARFDGEFESSGEPPRPRTDEELTAAFAPASAAAVEEPPPPALDMIGAPSTQHVAYAHALVEGLPGPLAQAAREPLGACAVIYALLLDDDKSVRATQLELLQKSADEHVLFETRRMKMASEELVRAGRLPLVDIALGSLRGLSPRQYAAFRDNVSGLVRADAKIDAFEWALQRMVLHHLEPNFTPRKRRVAQFYTLRHQGTPCSELLSTLAHVGHRDDAEGAAEAFRQGARLLGDVEDLRFLDREQCGLSTLDRSIEALGALSAPLKRQVLTAAAEVICADHEITVLEGELFRAIADSLDCPVPPLLPGQPLT